MLHLLLTVGLCLTFCSKTINSQAFPGSIIKRCRAGDNDCLAKTITKILHDHYDGIPEIGMPAMDPAHFGNAVLSQSPDSPVSINLTFSDGDLIGWKNLVVTKVVGFEKDPRNSKFELSAEVPVDILASKYEMSGRMLLVPLQGRGNLKIQHENLRMNVRFIMKVVTRNNEDYVRLKKTECDIFAKSVKYDFENLFNNKEISDGLNIAINSNSEIVFDSTRVGFGVARAESITRMIGPIFEKFPYRMFFADE